MRGSIELMIQHLEPLREEMIKDGRFDEAQLLRDIKDILEREAQRSEALRALQGVCDEILTVEDGGKSYIKKLAECKRALVIPALQGA